MDEGGGYLVSGTSQREGVKIAHLTLVGFGRAQQGADRFIIVLHQLHKAHSSRTFQCGNSEMGNVCLCTIRRFGRRLFRLGRFLRLLRFGGLLAAGGQGQDHRQGQSQGKQFFLQVHGFSSFHTLPAGA